VHELTNPAALMSYEERCITMYMFDIIAATITFSSFHNVPRYPFSIFIHLYLRVTITTLSTYLIIAYMLQVWLHVNII